MSDCGSNEKRTLTVALKQAGQKAGEIVKLAIVIEARLGGLSPQPGKSEDDAPAAPRPECLLETAGDLNSALSHALARLDRIVANL